MTSHEILGGYFDVALRDHLDAVGLADYLPLFEENHITPQMLPDLNDVDLRDIGVASLGHRKRLLAAFAQAKVTPDQVTERRDVVILFADLVGSTSLTRSRDEEDAFKLMAGFFDLVDGVITEAGGTVERHIGDAVMAVFGAPQARGDEARRAVRTALVLHERIAALGRDLSETLRLRVGLASGHVIFQSGIRDAEWSIVGTSVNLAARLAADAGPGETLITEAVRLSCTDELELGSPNTATYKGFDAPVRSWPLRGAHAPRAPLCVGRDAEMRGFEATLEAAEKDRVGRVLILRGEAGIGKSTLLRRWADRASVRGIDCRIDNFLDFGAAQGSTMTASLANWLEQRIAVEHPTLAGHRLILKLLSNEALTAADRALIDAMPASTRTQREAAALTDLVRAATEIGPILIAFEDAHWADADLLDLLAVLAELTAEVPLLLVLTSRIEGDKLDHSWRTQLDRAPVWNFDIGPLTAEDCTRLARDLAGDQMDIDASISRSRGHPLYLEQLLRHQIENQRGSIPHSIQTLVQARVDILASPDRRAARAASVLGQNVPIDALRTLVEDPGYDGRALLDRHILRAVPGGFAFTHALIRDGIFESILREEKVQFHQRAADWFTDRDLALRAEHLAAIDDPQAAQEYLNAARSAMTQNRAADALRLAEAGREARPSHALSVELSLVIGQAQIETGHADRAIEIFGEAAEMSRTDARARTRARIGSVAAMRIADRTENVFELIDLAEAEAREHALAEELSELLYYRGALLFPLGEFEASLLAHDESLGLARQCGSPERQALALSGRGDAFYAEGRMRSAYEVFEECLGLCDTHRLGRVQAANLFMRGTTRIYFLELEQALEDALTSAEIAAQVGHGRAEIVSRLTAGWVHAWTGEFDAAEQEANKGLEIVAAIDAPRFRPFLRETIGAVALARGNRSSAVEILRECWSECQALGAERFIGAWILGSLAAALPDKEARADALAQGEALLAGNCVGHNHFQYRRLAMQACFAAGDTSALLHHATALESFTQDDPTPLSDHFIQLARVAADGSTPDANFALLPARAT